MSLVYQEEVVKKRTLFSPGDPEPKLSEGELFIYLSKLGKSFVMEAEKTPVSNSFLLKNKIEYRIRMKSGPFIYTHSNEYMTADHSKKFKIEIRLRLEIADALKLYESNINDINAYINNIIPAEISKTVEFYEMNEILDLQRKMRDVEVFDLLMRELKTIGLRVSEYTAYVDKDMVEQEHDKIRRATDVEIEVKMKRAGGDIALNQKTKMMEYKANMELIQFYTHQIETGQDPKLVLRMIRDEEERALVQDYWKDAGLLLETSQKEKLTSKSEFDELLDELENL